MTQGEAGKRFVWTREHLALIEGARMQTRGDVGAWADIAIDTRAATLNGAVFVALRGERHDGHGFCREAIQKGARAIIVERPIEGIPHSILQLRVPSTRRALAQLALMKRQKFTNPVVAITGSAGKTSTKEFARAWMGENVYANPGNFNNDVGVPLSIFAAPLDAKAWLLELGMNHAGEIGQLTDCVRPDLGVLLPAGKAHVGTLGGESEVLAAKAEMLTSRFAPRLALIADERYATFGYKGTLRRVGNQRDADYRIVSAGGVFPEGLTVQVAERAKRFTFRTGLFGSHWALPIATAWAIGRELRLLVARDARRSSVLVAPPGRMNLVAWRGGWIVDDTYNASPGSFVAALDTVRPLATKLRLRLLVGDLRELGTFSAEIHRELAVTIRALKPTWVGVIGKTFAAALKKAGVPYQAFRDAGAGLRVATGHWKPGTILLAKGANGSGLYDVMQKFREAECSTSF